MSTSNYLYYASTRSLRHQNIAKEILGISRVIMSRTSELTANKRGLDRLQQLKNKLLIELYS